MVRNSRGRAVSAQERGQDQGEIVAGLQDGGQGGEFEEQDQHQSRDALGTAVGVLHEGQGALGVAAAAGPGVDGVGQAVQVEVTWTVAGIGDDGSVLVVGRAGRRQLPSAYVTEHVELAYATTAYGAQGDTVDTAHLVIGETTGAAAAYVGMTRGRHHNTAHLVAESLDDARRQWIDVFSRDRADLGPAHAARAAAEDIERFGPQAPRRSPSLQAAMFHTGVRRPPEPPPVTATQPRPGIGR
ncbi:MAG: hypothetical protein V9G13_10675 [Marmoricola sp.]